MCALSGGPDSAALVALAVAADLDVRTVHVDHGLRPDSADDASTAQGIADRFGVPFRCERVELADGANLESRARAARRAAVGVGALTGHTADDQAETLLLRLLRGAGGAGLAAMSPGPTKPILALRRAETHELCTLLDLTVADDPTNTDRRFRRNRMRHDVIPLLNVNEILSAENTVSSDPRLSVRATMELPRIERERTVLVVEDSEITRALVAGILTEIGMKVIEADDGQLRKPWVVSDLLQQLQTIHARHLHVGEHEVDLLALEQLPSVPGVA